jgi:hypothetical protein
VQKQAELQEQRLQLARQEAARSEGLATRGLLSLRDRDARRAAALSAEQDMATQRRLISSTEREISDVNARMSAIVLEKTTASAESTAAEANHEQRKNDAGARRVHRAVAGRRAGRRVAGRRATGIAGGTVAVVIPRAQSSKPSCSPVERRRFIRPAGYPPDAQAFPHQRFGTIKARSKRYRARCSAPPRFRSPA